MFVHGPPGDTQSKARYPALPLCHSLLSKDAIVILDDYYREDEKEMATLWAERYPGFTLRIVPHEKGHSGSGASRLTNPQSLCTPGAYHILCTGMVPVQVFSSLRGSESVAVWRSPQPSKDESSYRRQGPASGLQLELVHPGSRRSKRFSSRQVELDVRCRPGCVSTGGACHVTASRRSWAPVGSHGIDDSIDIMRPHACKERQPHDTNR